MRITDAASNQCYEGEELCGKLPSGGVEAKMPEAGSCQGEAWKPRGGIDSAEEGMKDQDCCTGEKRIRERKRL